MRERTTLLLLQYILHNKLYKIDEKEEEVMKHNTNIHIDQATKNTDKLCNYFDYYYYYLILFCIPCVCVCV